LPLSRYDPVTRPLYVQYGCGLCTGRNWLNYDCSPTLRLQRVPLLGPVLLRATGAVRFPPEARYGDICRTRLAPPRSCAGIYASHVLEHLSLQDFAAALRHTFEMLQPGGVFRLIVPDLKARAQRYIASLESGADDANAVFMRSSHLGMETRPRGIVGMLRHHGNSAHLWMWDEPSLVRALSSAGFVDIRRCAFNDSEDPMFREVEEPDRFFDRTWGIQELAIECRGPRT
jgi:methyltransferase family protein